MWEQLIKEVERIAKLNDQRLAVRVSPVLGGKAWVSLFMGSDRIGQYQATTLDMALEDCFEGLEASTTGNGLMFN